MLAVDKSSSPRRAPSIDSLASIGRSEYRLGPPSKNVENGSKAQTPTIRAQSPRSGIQRTESEISSSSSGSDETSSSKNTITQPGQPQSGTNIPPAQSLLQPNENQKPQVVSPQIPEGTEIDQSAYLPIPGPDMGRLTPQQSRTGLESQSEAVGRPESLHSVDQCQGEFHTGRFKQTAFGGPNSGSPKLNAWDVAAFIINNMVGTGILVYPPLVLQNTQSKWGAIVFWWVGFVCTFFSTYIYLGLGKAWFFNGGELIYIDELSRKFRWKKLRIPKMLPFLIYGFYFVLLSNSEANSMQFGHQILIVSDPNLARLSESSNAYLSLPLQTVFAIGAVTIFCLINYLSVKVGRRLNKGFAFLKVGVLFALLVKGIISAVKFGSIEDYGENRGPPLASGINHLAPRYRRALAFLYVLFAYQGWENSSFVLGEVEDYYHLKTGSYLAIGLVGIFYCLIGTLFTLAYRPDVNDFQSVASLFGNSDRVIRTWAVITAISACGNLVSVIYTAARVKLVFAKSMILPWSRLWTRVSETRSTPTGGVLLHWIFSCILILAATSIKNRDEQITLVANMRTYGHCILIIPLVVGFWFLPKIVQSEDYEDRCALVCIRRNSNNKLAKKRNWVLSLVSILGSLSANLYALITFVYCNPTASIPGWVFLVVNLGVFGLAIGYFMIIKLFWTGSWRWRVNGYEGEFKDAGKTDTVFGRRTTLELKRPVSILALSTKGICFCDQGSGENWG
ncbi:hypothetical protein TWF788_001845 [Orbilia oligospora]|uniref:Amino acid transporter n=1 Tax=Orbilia oligospora TaxID=2813651 RepID=A0A7C8Q0L1_ORBOL|nr:hypothetical protein TWF788_001845 [Orbilia oligospora]